MYQRNYFTLSHYGHSDSRSYLPDGDYLQAVNHSQTNNYLREVDKLLEKAQQPYSSSSDDLVSAVFANQAAKHQMTSYQLVWLIYERKVLAERHKRDIQHRLGEMFEARSITKMLNPADDGRRLNTVERQIIDLERQEHDAELGLWKDTLELRTQLLEERTEYQATRRRINLLSGGQYGRV